MIEKGQMFMYSKELSSKNLHRPFYEQNLRLSSFFSHFGQSDPQKNHMDTNWEGFTTSSVIWLKSFIELPSNNEPQT